MSILDQNTNEGAISPKMKESYATMSPWLRFIGIFGMIVTAIYILLLLIGLASGGQSIINLSGAMGYFSPAIIIIIILLLMALGFYLSLLLYQSGSRMKNFARYNDVYALEEAIVKQKNYWVIAGVSLAAYLILIVVAIIYLISIQ